MKQSDTDPLSGPRPIIYKADNAQIYRTIKWPCHSYIARAADKYATESKAHTLNYSGWQNSKLSERIRIGRFGQEYLRAFCKVNKISCETDGTDSRTVDKFDLNIRGALVDVKTSNHPELWPQVGAHLKGSAADYYAFFRCNEQMNWITFLGWTSAEHMFDAAHYVPKGANLPGARGLTQRFSGGSYFLNESFLHDTGEFVVSFRTGIFFTNEELNDGFSSAFDPDSDSGDDYETRANPWD